MKLRFLVVYALVAVAGCTCDSRDCNRDVAVGHINGCCDIEAQEEGRAACQGEGGALAVCDSNVCVPAGGMGLLCGENNACAAGLMCERSEMNRNTCQDCGERDERCCALPGTGLATCEVGLLCQPGTNRCVQPDITPGSGSCVPGSNEFQIGVRHRATKCAERVVQVHTTDRAAAERCALAMFSAGAFEVAPDDTIEAYEVCTRSTLTTPELRTERAFNRTDAEVCALSQCALSGCFVVPNALCGP